MPSAISDELAAGLGRRIQPTFSYYRQPNGWITISTNTELEQLRYTKEGWQYLGSYGAFDMTPYVVNHPLEGLLMFGGVKELSVDQIIETGLAFNPPLVPNCREHITQYHRSHTQACWRGAKRAEFPQLENVPKELIGPFICEFCDRKDIATKKALSQHQQVAHKEPMGHMQLGRSLGNTITGVLGPQVTAAPTISETQLRRLAELEAKEATQSVKPLETCGCGTTYKAGGAALHKRSTKHKAWAKKNQIEVPA